MNERDQAVEWGREGGKKLLAERGPEYYREIGRKGAETMRQRKAEGIPSSTSNTNATIKGPQVQDENDPLAAIV